MSQRDNRLFYKYDLDAKLRFHANEIPHKLKTIPRDQFLRASADALVEYVLTLVHIQPLEIDSKYESFEQNEGKIDVSEILEAQFNNIQGPVYASGIIAKIALPYVGDAELFGFKPNLPFSHFPHGSVRQTGAKSGLVDIIVHIPLDRAKAIAQIIADEITHIQTIVRTQKLMIEANNAAAPDLIRLAIAARLEKLKRDEEIIPEQSVTFKRRQSTPSLTPTAIHIKSLKSAFSSDSEISEPAIADEQYRKILKVIRHVGKTLSFTPKTYLTLGESELRDILLANLNEFFQHPDAAAVFERHGAAGIRIATQERAVFFVACAQWNGEKELIDTMQSLLQQAAWNDCKAALMLINRQIARFIELQIRIPDILRAHPQFVREAPCKEHNQWRYVYRATPDTDRHVTITTFFFDLFVK